MTQTADPQADNVAATPPRATYTDLFRVGQFRVLFIAHVVSMLGTVVAEVALTVLVFERTASPALAALTFTVGFLPYLFGGALFSGLVDRMPARRTLVVCDVTSAVCFAVMTVPGLPVPVLLGLVFAAGLVAPVFGGARAALLPQVLGDGQRYVLGRSTIRMVAQGAQVIGFAVGGLLLASIGARGALVADAASFVASAALIRSGLGGHAPVAPDRSSLVRDSLAGLGAVLSLRPVRRIVLLRWLLPTCAVAPEALAVPYVHAHGGSQRLVGVYMAMIPTTMVLADLVVGRFAGRQLQQRLVMPASLVATIPLLAFGFRPPLGVAMPLLAVVGFGYCSSLGLDSLLIEVMPESLRSRGLAVDQAGLMFLQGVGFAVWGAVAELLPLSTTVVVAGVCGVCAVLLLRPQRPTAATNR